MYTPPAFAVPEREKMFEMIRARGLATFITATADGPVVTPIPMFLIETEGEFGTLYGHFARANPHWKMPMTGQALALFMGPDAYVTPSWYASKAEHGKVVPTWNYQAVEARGAAEFIEEPTALRWIVERLTDLHEAGQPRAWHVHDAPVDFINMQLRAIVGIRLPITSLEAKSKMSQNRNEADRRGVREGLSSSGSERDRTVAAHIPD